MVKLKPRYGKSLRVKTHFSNLKLSGEMQTNILAVFSNRLSKSSFSAHRSRLWPKLTKQAVMRALHLDICLVQSTSNLPNWYKLKPKMANGKRRLGMHIDAVFQKISPHTCTFHSSNVEWHFKRTVKCNKSGQNAVNKKLWLTSTVIYPTFRIEIPHDSLLLSTINGTDSQRKLIHA